MLQKRLTDRKLVLGSGLAHLESQRTAHVYDINQSIVGESAEFSEVVLQQSRDFNGCSHKSNLEPFASIVVNVGAYFSTVSVRIAQLNSDTYASRGEMEHWRVLSKRE